MKAGWLRTAVERIDDDGGVLTLAEFCLEGPAVAEVSALITVQPANPRVVLLLYVDDGSGKELKTFQST